MIESLEYLLYAAITGLFGWFSLHVFVSDRWPETKKKIFGVVVTIVLFVAFGLYHLNTGKNAPEQITDALFCAVHSFAYCPNAAKAPGAQIGSSGDAQAPSVSSQSEQAQHDTQPAIRQNNSDLGTASQPPPDPQTLELEYWNSISNSQDIRLYQSYLRKYPNGQFADVAQSRIDEFHAKDTKAPDPGEHLDAAQQNQPSQGDTDRKCIRFNGVIHCD